MEEAPVMVGYDGSTQADVAVEWAAAQAAASGVPLAVVTTAEVVVVDDLTHSHDIEKAARDWAQRVVADGAERARKAAPSVPITIQAHVGHPVDVLVKASDGAGLAVVGSRGHGSFVGALLGSVAFALSAGSRCPVVVVRGDSATPGPGRPVVVGVDGSPAACVALDTAADLAASWGADLTVLAAWHLAAVNSWAIAYGAEMAQGTDRVTDIEREADKMANRAAGQARARQPGLHVTTVVEALPPAPALVSASHGAGLVVVGNRGRGRVAGLLLGSVSHATIHGASCPVAVVRSDSR